MDRAHAEAARGPVVTKVPTVVQTSCTDVLLYLQLNGSGPESEYASDQAFYCRGDRI